MKKQKKIDIVVYFVFILLSIIFILPIYHLRMSDDLAFHISRIQEISQCLRKGSLPKIYTYTFGKFGYPIGIFYPQLTVIPFSIFSMALHSTIKGIYTGIFFYTYLTLIFTYIVSKKLWKQSTSFWISFIYAFSCYRFIDTTTRFALGEMLGMTFLPLAFYGLYAILRGNYSDWPFLAFGLSAIMLSHILSTFIVIIFLIIIFVILLVYVKDNIVKRFISLIKSVLTFMAATLTFVVPFLIQSSYQKISTPSSSNIPEVYSIKREFYNTILNSCYNELSKSPITGLTGGYTIGFTEFLIIIFGILMFRKLDKINRTLLIIGSLVYFAQYIPCFWNLIWKTPLKNIQFPWRTLMIASFFLAVVGGNLISVLMAQRGHFITIAISLAFILVPWVMGTLSYEITAPRITDISKIAPSWGLSQYTPDNAQKYLGNVANHVVFVNQSSTKLCDSEVISSPNELTFKNTLFYSKGLIILPMCYYKGLYVYQDGVLLKSVNNKGLISVYGNGKSDVINVKYQAPFIEKLSDLISFVTWGTLVLVLIVKRYKRI